MSRLGERTVRIRKVVGSIPIGSTKNGNRRGKNHGDFSFDHRNTTDGFGFDHLKGTPFRKERPSLFTVPQNLRWHFCALRLRYRTFLAPEFRPNLIIVSLHGGHGHTQLPCKIAFIAHAGIFTQVFGQLFFLGADPRLGTPLLYQI